MTLLLRRSHLLVLAALVTTLVAALAIGTPAPAAHAMSPVDPYARYEPQTGCTGQTQPGTVALGRQVTSRYGSRIIGDNRPCNQGGRSEHKDGRAFDWAIDVNNGPQRQMFFRFMNEHMATINGDHAARARRLGIMYIIWDDAIYASWNQFRPQPYLNAACTSVNTCSRPLRHLDHVHISMSWAGAKQQTTWWTG